MYDEREDGFAVSPQLMGEDGDVDEEEVADSPEEGEEA